MKKGILKVLPLVLGGVMCISLASCDDPQVSATPTPTPTPQVEKVTVTFKNGDEVVHTVEVEKGSKVSVWDPSLEISDSFFGWYGEPTLTHEFDFSTAVNEDVTIFGSFVGYQKDERHWGIAGSGSSKLLSSSNWGKVFNEEHYLKNESTATENIFTITLDLFKGDQFQFTAPVISESSISWGHQRGAKYLEDPEKDGVTYFSLGGSLGGDNSTANITVEKEGNYKFTLKTYPKGDFQKDGTTNTYDNRSYYDSISYSYLGEPTEAQAEYETTFFIKGADITGWGNYINSSTMMTYNSDKTVATLEHIYLKASDEFMFASSFKEVATGVVTDGNVYIRATNLTEESKALVEGTGNMKVKVDGYYTFSYNVESTALTVTKVEYTPAAGAYYFDGSFCSWGGAGNDTYKLVQDATNPDIYRLADPVVLAVNDEIGLQYYDKDGEDGKKYNGFFSAKNMVANEAFNLTAGNNAKVVVAGTYTVEFNAYRHLLTLIPVVSE